MNGSQTVADVLNAAADLIEPEGAWTRGVLARNASGNLVMPCNPEAICWCALGAIRVAGHFVQAATRSVCFFRRHIGVESIEDWNDATGRTQVEVVAALRAAAIAAQVPA